MYNVIRYKDIIQDQDADTQKRFGMIERLSKNFSVENKTALDMDKLLTEQLELENSNKEESPEKSETPKPTPKKKNFPTNNNISVEEKFDELFEVLKNQSPSGISPDALEDNIREAIKGIKIHFENLDPEIQQRLSSQPQIIQYKLPNVVTPSFSKPPIASFQNIVDDIILGNNVMFVGGAGTGKTFLAEILIAKTALKREHITINCSQWTSPTEIIGGQTMDGYVEGKLIEAWKNGYVLVLDELPKIDPNTAGLFNDALSKTKIPNAIIFNSRKESFTKHPDFACIATGNIYPDKESVSYGANNKQDLSLLDRFSGSVYFIEKNPVIEKEILQNDMIWSICNKMRSVIEELKYEAQLSLRFMQNARDGYNLEMQRVKEKGKNGIKPEEGKTLLSTIDSFLSTFTELQQKNIKDKIRYNGLINGYAYREFDKAKLLF